MEKKTAAIPIPREIFSQTKEQSVEADLLLPDYYPEISKILDCTVALREEAVTVTADKISVSGAARVRLLYASAQNELKAYETQTKYTKLISGSNFESGDLCTVHQSVTSLNYRAVSPRKVEVRALAAVKAEIVRLEATLLLSDVENDRIQKRAVTAETFRINAYAGIHFDLNDKISLPVTGDRISGFLRENVKIVWNEVRAIQNKLMLGGIAEITFVYITTENTVSPECSLNLPFTQICDLYGTAENDECCISVKNTGVSIEIKDPGTVSAEASASIRVDALVITGKPEELTYLDDAYSVKADLQIQASQVNLPQRISQPTDTVSFSGDVQSFDVQIGEICDKCISDISCTASVAQTETRLNGSFRLGILVKTADGAYDCFSRSCSFEHVLRGAGEASLSALEIEPRSLSAEIAAGGTIRYSGELDVKYILTRETARNVLTEIEEPQPTGGMNEEKIVLYYGEKGESLWNIAKENRTPFSSLKALNSLQEDVLNENKLLIFHT